MTKNKAISDEQIIASIMSSRTFKQAAEACGISIRDIHLRMKDADFRAEYKAAKDEVLRQAVQALSEHLLEAVTVTAGIMNDEKVNPATRLQAAQTILSYSTRLADVLSEHEVETRKENASMFDELFD